jgi:hypothetical protein
MTIVREVVIVTLMAVCWTATAQAEAPAGTHEVTMRMSEVDQTLSEIAPHAEQLPLHFASNELVRP